MRRAFVAGNWKMHGSSTSVVRLLGELLDGLGDPGVDVAVCPPHPYLSQAVALCAGSAVTVGGQDCSDQAPGAHTGEVAAGMLADLECDWVILGHSERRQNQGESDDLIRAKLGAARDAGLKPVLCVGETQEQRGSGQAEQVVQSQLDNALKGLKELGDLVLAYEPVWAIGTGLTATPEQAQDIHAFIRGWLSGAGLDGAGTRILYGGSVKAANAAELFAQPDIDGALVGGAALDAMQFKAIIDAAASN